MLNSQKGVTLVELLIAMIVASLVATMIFGGFSLFHRHWIPFQVRQDLHTSFIRGNRLLRRVLDKANGVTPKAGPEWEIMIDTTGHLLQYNDESVLLHGKNLFPECKVDSFAMHPDTAVSPVAGHVFKYYLALSKRQETIQLVSRFALSPVPFKQPTISNTKKDTSTMVWENR